MVASFDPNWSGYGFSETCTLSVPCPILTCGVHAHLSCQWNTMASDNPVTIMTV